MFCSILAQAFCACNNGAHLPISTVRVIALTYFLRRNARQNWGQERMDIATSAVDFPTYPSMADLEPYQPEIGQETQPDPEVSFTQPVARRPIEQQCGEGDPTIGGV